MSVPSTKTCPDCAEEIKAEARVCRYCGYRFDVQDDAQRPGDVAEAPGVATTSLTPSARNTTAEERVAAAANQGGRRGRWLLGFIYAAAVTLWIICVIPLAGVSADGDSSTEVASGFVAAILVSLGAAALVRLVYAIIRHRSFLSPWLFVIAAAVAVISVVGQNARETEATDRAAVERRVAESANEVTPVQRCVTKVLEDLDTVTPEQRALVSGNTRTFAFRFCDRAKREGVLDSTGNIYATETFQIVACTDGMLVSYDRVPVAERDFSRADFEVFGARFCEEAISRDLEVNARFGANRREQEALQKDVLNELLESGQIERLP